MKQEIEEALKQKKELTSATVRLNGMLKTGQDALKAEQDQVAKLRAQLSEKSKVKSSPSPAPSKGCTSRRLDLSNTGGWQACNYHTVWA